jgi:hypothetical protein
MHEQLNTLGNEVNLLQNRALNLNQFITLARILIANISCLKLRVSCLETSEIVADLPLTTVMEDRQQSN